MPRQHHRWYEGPPRYGPETNPYERDEEAAAIGHTRAQHNREREPQRREGRIGPRDLGNEQLK